MIATTAFAIALLIGQSAAQSCVEVEFATTTRPAVKLYRQADGNLTFPSITVSLSRPWGWQNSAYNYNQWIWDTDWYQPVDSEDSNTTSLAPIFKAVSEFGETNYVTWRGYGNKDVTLSFNDAAGISNISAAFKDKLGFRMYLDTASCTSEIQYALDVIGYKRNNANTAWIEETFSFCPEVFIVGNKPTITLQQQSNGTFTMAPVSFKISRPKGYQNKRFHEKDWKFESNWYTNTYSSNTTDFNPIFSVNPDPIKWFRFGHKTVTLGLAQSSIPVVVLGNTMGFRMRLVLPSTDTTTCNGTNNFSTVLPVVAKYVNGSTIDWTTYTAQFSRGSMKKRSLERRGSYRTCTQDWCKLGQCNAYCQPCPVGVTFC